VSVAATDVLRIGTRGSALAVRQAEWVASELRARRPGLGVEIHRIKTSGDRIATRSLAEIGGKGLFVKEIEDVLLAGLVDVGVHSMKDLPAKLAEGLAIASVPRREDPRDVLVSAGAGGIGGLRRGARVGTGSLRRRAFLMHARPDLDVVPLRGNVDTRIGKWRAGEVDALVLAAAGLRRLGLVLPEARALPAEEFLPAIGQGALAIEASPESGWSGLLRELDDPDSSAAVGAERAVLVAIGGDCTTPIAAHAVLDGDILTLRAALADPAGRRMVRAERRGGRDEGERIGREVGEELLTRGGSAILAELAALAEERRR
jgi:hydroxymethylbilane synthase